MTDTVTQLDVKFCVEMISLKPIKSNTFESKLQRHKTGVRTMPVSNMTHSNELTFYYFLFQLTALHVKPSQPP